MKNKNLMFGMILMAAFFMIIPSHASASIYSGDWQPSNGTVFTVQIASGDPNGYTGNDFYLYDWGDDVTNPGYQLTDALLILSDGTNAPWPAATITFTYSSGSWTAMRDSASINLGPTKDFGFFFWRADGTVLNSYGLAQLGQYIYELESSRSDGAAMAIIVSGAAPVPIPSALLLFGSGLFGVIGFRRHRRLNQ